MRVVNADAMWKPEEDGKTHIRDFTATVNDRRCLKLGNDYFELYKWSCHNYSQFWEDFWRYSGLVHSRPYERVIDATARIDDIPEWFPGTLLNYAENLLRHRDRDKVALYGTGESLDGVRRVTFGQLRERVAQYAAAMKKIGVEQGDRVVGYLPNCIEAVEAMLATASLGAVWSSTSPDFGVQGVLERFCQIEPKLLFSVSAIIYNGKRHDHLRKLSEVVRRLPSLQKVVLVPFVPGDDEIPQGLLRLEDFLPLGVDSEGHVPDLHFTQVPFSQPLFILYSSGTTGTPKCIVHSVGGTLIQHLKEHMLQGNMSDQDKLMFYTTTGWMMWNWMMSALSLGTSLVLYDGSPVVPSVDVLWDLVDTLGITVLGTSAKWLSIVEERDSCPMKSHHLGSLRMILSTGSPLKPQSYDYVYGRVKRNVLLGSISGGTDIIGCFVGHCVVLPVHRGEVQCPLLGMAMECWSDRGTPVWGERGELVCTQPHPSMPVCFWNDAGMVKYKKAYFSPEFPGVWRHGDFCLFNPDTKGLVMLGRSDGTLNPNGVRFGSAEIYQIVETFDQVEDSVCVAHRKGEEEQVVLFVKLGPGVVGLDSDLVSSIRAAIRTQLSARHVPAVILETKDIPYTINGKKVEVAVRDVVAGLQVKNRHTLRNPESLDLFANIPELQ